MSTNKVISIIGTRPEAIKMAPLIKLLSADPDLEHKLVVTAQHRQLLDDVLDLFNLAPDHDLDLMREGQSLEYVTSEALQGLGKAIAYESPGFVLVHGDTTTTLAGALAAFYQRIPFGHVEAGLRTSSLHTPFPEELNRRITDIAADQLYCPTPAAAANLAATLSGSQQVYVTGNTALDTAAMVLDPNHKFTDPGLARFAAHDGPKVVVTAHRRENWGQPLEGICHAIERAAVRFPKAMFAACWHPNPAVRDTMLPILGDNPSVLLIDPPPYGSFINLLAKCDLVLTDSGGIQEEITSLNSYALVLREETERPEAVEAGYAEVVGTCSEAILAAIERVLPECLGGSLPKGNPSPFGDGKASRRIHVAIRHFLGLDSEPPKDFHP